MNNGILSGPIDLDPRKTRRYPSVPALPGTPLRHRPSGVVGRIVRFNNERIAIRDGSGREHSFLLTAGNFEIDGKQCLPVMGKKETSAATQVSASGSIATSREAQIAKASRILVEGIHDAELVEKIWGDDLRHEGIVIERLDGMDDLVGVVRDFDPKPGRRLGILLDHLVDGSKESRVASAIHHPHVLITGTPYVDVWAAVKPGIAGIDEWPQVPMGESWKEGTLARIGRRDMHPGAYWKELLAKVNRYSDLQSPLVGAVEQLIDFVTLPD